MDGVSILLLLILFGVVVEASVIFNNNGIIIGDPSVRNRKTKLQYIVKCCGNYRCFDMTRSANITTVTTPITTPTTPASTTTPTTTTTSPEVCLPTCPETVCTKDPLKFDGAGKLVNPGQYGDWTTTCGKTYVNYKTSLVYADAWKACCAIGMNLIGIDDAAELQCMQDWTTSLGILNGRSWVTSASSTGCVNRYFSCPIANGLSSPAVFIDNPKWKAGEGNAETVLFLMKDWGTLKYWDAHGGVEHWFICEGTDPR